MALAGVRVVVPPTCRASLIPETTPGGVFPGSRLGKMEDRQAELQLYLQGKGPLRYSGLRRPWHGIELYPLAP